MLRGVLFFALTLLVTACSSSSSSSDAPPLPKCTQAFVGSWALKDSVMTTPAPTGVCAKLAATYSETATLDSHGSSWSELSDGETAPTPYDSVEFSEDPNYGFCVLTATREQDEDNGAKVIASRSISLNGDSIVGLFRVSVSGLGAPNDCILDYAVAGSRSPH